MFKNSQEVMAFIKKEKVEFIDARFIDINGRWQHFSMPNDGFEEDFFKEGIGFDGSSIQGFQSIEESDLLLSSIQGFQSIEESDLLLIPDPKSAFVDPFTDDKTLVLIGNIQDPRNGQPYSKDPRRVSIRAEEYIKQTKIGDTVYIGPEAEFFIFDSVILIQRVMSPAMDTGSKIRAVISLVPLRTNFKTFEV
jgi:glutamine synthetase